MHRRCLATGSAGGDWKSEEGVACAAALAADEGENVAMHHGPPSARPSALNLSSMFKTVCETGRAQWAACLGESWGSPGPV